MPKAKIRYFHGQEIEIELDDVIEYRLFSTNAQSPRGQVDPRPEREVSQRDNGRTGTELNYLLASVAEEKPLLLRDSTGAHHSRIISLRNVSEIYIKNGD